MLVGYARVSTFDQDPQLQIDALLESEVDERHLFEEKASGKDSNRVKLKEALDFLKKNDIFVVWKLDRLGRSLQDLIRIVGDLKKRGVGFKSLTEGIDTTHPGGVLIFHIFGALAQFERELIQERTRAGLEAARKKGRKGRRPKSISEEQRELMYSLLKEGRGVSAVARVLGVSRYTIYREK
ncbi:MAG: recombinase family protein [Chlamydiota bacterium]